MIGMINLPPENVTEYYAVPRKFEHSSNLNRPTSLGNLPISKHGQISSKPAPSPVSREIIKTSLELFTQHKQKPTHSYCSDGRKCKDGRPVTTAAPSKLWDELLMRKMVNKINGEIASPKDQLSNIQKTFRTLNLLNRQTSRSEPSLVSEEKETSARICDVCNAAIERELNEVEKYRSSSDALPPMSPSNDNLLAVVFESSALNRSNPGSTHDLCDACS